MVDPLDELMSDYITGMLEVKINYIKKTNTSIKNEHMLENNRDYQKNVFKRRS